MQIDQIKRLPSWKRVPIKDRTHIVGYEGKRIPTFKNMERQLIKSLKNA